ncbi:M48 family metalloprotease [uncultured Pseudoteredinibacter sp.]|uniref:M48 family metalloprotease n=1 Tax=uncultured Pseudoteredinibacter sp. TaxID=1641701 RepID=UPI00260C3A8E|nr:M48 family metalloprotease [uncultured Pseudoteredinibacter sp.]
MGISSKPLACLTLSLSLAFAASPLSAQKKEIKLPSLGDATSGIVSPQQEYKLGQAWARSFRAQVPTSIDAQLADYTEKLMSKLAEHSELHHKQLDIIMVDNPTLNAFAVPGGVVGVHTGLFAYAQSEGQLGAVLAHELAHLSQRHFARGVEQQQRNTLPMLAALMTSLVLAATTSGDAGLAALSATQAAAIDAKLRFSRQNEQEADRIGIQTMAAAGLDPYQAPAMFEQMLKATQFSRRPPEFLLTHPVTEKRVADTRNRARRYVERPLPPSLDFHLMRSRVRLALAETPSRAAKSFASELEGHSLLSEASRYGLLLALIDMKEIKKAQEQLDILLEDNPEHVSYLIAKADLMAANGNYDGALMDLRLALKKNPHNHPVTVRLAELYMESGQYHRGEQLLLKHSRQRPHDTYVWYLLAEIHGLTGDILNLHQARAEYFVLNGIYDKALHQLKLAQKMARGNYRLSTILEEKIRQVYNMIEDQRG